MRRWDRSFAPVALLCLAAAACRSPSSTPTPAAAPIPPAVQLPPSPVPPIVRVLVNGEDAPSVDALCSRGVFVATRLSNPSTVSVQTRRITVSFDVIAGSCVPHVAGIEPELERVIPAGTEQEIRVFDAAGSLCHDPNGALSCSWRATSTVETDSGTAAGSLDFRTSAPVPRVDAGCERTPVIVSPHDGDVVSGVVPIQFTVVESSRCIITARTIVRVYSERGDLVAESVPYDVGEVFRWDTRRVENGRYRIRAAQNCCQIDGVAARVTVRN